MSNKRDGKLGRELGEPEWKRKNKQTMAPPPRIIWLNLKVDLVLETPEKEKCNS